MVSLIINDILHGIKYCSIPNGDKCYGDREGGERGWTFLEKCCPFKWDDQGCLPEKVTFEQRAGGDERVSRTTVCSCASCTLLHFCDRHSYELCEEPYSHAPCLWEGAMWISRGSGYRQEYIICKGNDAGGPQACSRHRVRVGDNSRGCWRRQQEPVFIESCGLRGTLTSTLSVMGNNLKMWKRQLMTSDLHF